MKKIQIIWEHPSRPPEVGEDDLERILTVFLDKLGLGGHGVTLLVADDQTLAGLNRDHRGVAGPTDILSWGYLDPAAPEEQPQNDPTMDEVGPLLGEMAVSLDAAIRQAGENRWDLRTELFRLLAHGCAHLAGHDHQTPEQERLMLPLEESLLAAAGLEGLYGDGS